VMNVLVIGDGGREHALCWRLSQSPSVARLFFTGANPGMERLATPLNANIIDTTHLAELAERNSIDLTVVGPEAPLAAGIVDEFNRRGLPIFGPTRAAARLESSKFFAKQTMVAAGIPTAPFASFTDFEAARAYIKAQQAPLVVKADGLAAGKGVMICRDTATAIEAAREALETRRFGAAGERVVIEEMLSGEEISFFALVSDTITAPLACARDHKTIFENDRGPNTGGMGAYSPIPELSADFEEQVMERVVRPIATTMAARGTPYRGVLFVGLMYDGAQINVLEFNVRFGDPECQALMMRFEGDLALTLAAVAGADPGGIEARLSPRSAVAVVLASAGYPGDYRKGIPIEGLDKLEQSAFADGQSFRNDIEVKVFQAGTALRDGRIVTNGGRVLAVTAAADRLTDATAAAYAAADMINFEGKQMRRDIAKRSLASVSRDG
jgi:phosphoribosylamine--glycine ligase